MAKKNRINRFLDFRLDFFSKLIDINFTYLSSIMIDVQWRNPYFIARALAIRFLQLSTRFSLYFCFLGFNPSLSFILSTSSIAETKKIYKSYLITIRNIENSKKEYFGKKCIKKFRIIIFSRFRLDSFLLMKTNNFY